MNKLLVSLGLGDVPFEFDERDPFAAAVADSSGDDADDDADDYDRRDVPAAGSSRLPHTLLAPNAPTTTPALLPPHLFADSLRYRAGLEGAATASAAPPPPRRSGGARAGSSQAADTPPLPRPPSSSAPVTLASPYSLARAFAPGPITIIAFKTVSAGQVRNLGVVSISRELRQSIEQFRDDRWVIIVDGAGTSTKVSVAANDLNSTTSMFRGLGLDKSTIGMRWTLYTCASNPNQLRCALVRAHNQAFKGLVLDWTKFKGGAVVVPEAVVDAAAEQVARARAFAPGEVCMIGWTELSITDACNGYAIVAGGAMLVRQIENFLGEDDLAGKLVDMLDGSGASTTVRFYQLKKGSAYVITHSHDVFEKLKIDEHDAGLLLTFYHLKGDVARRLRYALVARDHSVFEGVPSMAIARGKASVVVSAVCARCASVGDGANCGGSGVSDDCLALQPSARQEPPPSARQQTKPSTRQLQILAGGGAGDTLVPPAHVAWEYLGEVHSGKGQQFGVSRRVFKVYDAALTGSGETSLAPKEAVAAALEAGFAGLDGDNEALLARMRRKMASAARSGQWGFIKIGGGYGLGARDEQQGQKEGQKGEEDEAKGQRPPRTELEAEMIDAFDVHVDAHPGVFMVSERDVDAAVASRPLLRSWWPQGHWRATRLKHLLSKKPHLVPAGSEIKWSRIRGVIDRNRLAHNPPLPRLFDD